MTQFSFIFFYLFSYYRKYKYSQNDQSIFLKTETFVTLQDFLKSVRLLMFQHSIGCYSPVSFQNNILIDTCAHRLTYEDTHKEDRQTHTHTYICFDGK